MATFRIDKQRYLPPADTIFEVMMLADKFGNVIGGANPSGMAVDAFGRARVSQPFTLFESHHRYQDNLKFSEQNSGSASSSHDANSSLVKMLVGSAAGDKCVRETNRVFSYQPGKSLLTLSTFTMEPAKTNLRQRVGYFGVENGIYLEQSDDVYLVLRTKVNGTIEETRIPQNEWNIDKLDGTGISEIILDLSKSQIFFTDIEWLGVGSVRCGFVINGSFIHCHTFHHANYITDTYMTTASLPGRLEIENTGNTGSSSTLKQICFAVISEGGYEIRGKSFTAGTPVASPKVLTTAGTTYPVISLRLKSSRLDAVAIPKALSMLGIGNNSRIQYKILTGTVLTGANWVSADPSSSVEYDLSATSFTGGVAKTQGFIGITNQAAQSIDLTSSEIFKYQLERNSIAGAPLVLTLAAVGLANGDSVVASLDWEEA